MAVLLVAAWGSDLALARPGGNRGGSHHSSGHHHFHHHGGRVVFFAAPLFVPRFYYPPPYYYPPAYYPPAPPPVYIEQLQPQPQGYWYYCLSAGAYYPHVQSCPGGWQRVAPVPPPG